MFFDAHTHHKPLNINVTAVTNRSFGRDYAPAAPYFSAGLHPWYIDQRGMLAAKSWLLEQVQHPDCVAIGETGLDKICETDWDLQMEAFVFCAETAIHTQKPLILHCVHAYEEVLAVKKRFGKAADQIRWIFHGFNKKPAVAEMLLRAGADLSFGAALLRPNSPAAATLQICPEGRFFLETDDRQDILIDAVYAAAEEILRREVPPLDFRRS